MEYKRKRLIRAALQKAEAKRKQTVRQAESAADTEQQTPEEYAQTVVSEKAAQAAENLQSKALDTGRISYRQFRILQEKRQRVPTTHAAQPAETESPPFAQSRKLNYFLITVKPTGENHSSVSAFGKRRWISGRSKRPIPTVTKCRR